jgi:hypothetical protein
MRNALRLGLLAALLSAVSAHASPVGIDLPQPEQTLKPGPGVEIASNDCRTCHSLDYIQTQPPHMGAAFWNAEVTKMIKTYGAPIPDPDAKAIADYLAQTY